MARGAARLSDCHFPHEPERAPQLQLALPLQHLRERLALQTLHHEEGDGGLTRSSPPLGHVEDADDVLLVQPRDAPPPVLVRPAQAVISLGHSLGLRVLAEGVETGEQQQFLKSHSSDECQGYLFARPAAPAELVTALERGILQPSP